MGQIIFRWASSATAELLGTYSTDVINSCILVIADGDDDDDDDDDDDG